MPTTLSTETKMRRYAYRSRTGVPAHAKGSARTEQEGTNGYGWAVELAGSVKLGGLKLLTSNRAEAKIRGPLRLT
jgi:hypothetical protein